MQNFIKKIDLQKLAGIKRILGVDLFDGGIRVVELEKKGNVFNRFTANYKVVQSFTHFFKEQKTSSDIGLEVKQMLAQHSVKTLFAVSSIRSGGVKTIVATIPADYKNIDEWIRDHYEKLLNIPLSLAALSYGYEILEKNEPNLVVEITFIRRKDIERYTDILKSAGLQLLTLGYGTRDAINTLYIDQKALEQKDFIVAYITNDTVELTHCKNGNRIATKHIAVKSEEEIAEAITGRETSAPLVFVLAEKSLERIPFKNVHLVEPLGLLSHYALAVGLAIRGFIPEVSPINFLLEKEQQDKDSLVYRSLFQRVVLTLGCFLLVLLCIPTVTSFYFGAGIEEVANAALSQGEVFTKVATLEREVVFLERKVQGVSSSIKPSAFARFLHDIAAVAPEQLWLYKLSVHELNNTDARFIISGYTRNNDNIPRFLKSLEKMNNCSEVNLVKAGLPGTADPMTFAQERPGPVVTFEIRGVMRH